MAFISDALVLNAREFNDFVGGYMEYWNLSPKDERNEEEKHNPRDLVDMPFGVGQMRAFSASAPNEMDDSDSFVLFGIDTSLYQIADLCRPDETHLDFRKTDTGIEAASSPQIYAVIKRSYETLEDVKENVKTYMPSDFDTDAHCGILELA